MGMEQCHIYLYVYGSPALLGIVYSDIITSFLMVSNCLFVEIVPDKLNVMYFIVEDRFLLGCLHDGANSLLES